MASAAPAPEIDSEAIVGPEQLVEKLVERVAASGNGKSVNMRMAVVLRPLQNAHRSYFVPSLRVGVLPKSEPLRDGFRTEAGEAFYLSLVTGLPVLDERDKRELAPGSEEPREEGR